MKTIETIALVAPSGNIKDKEIYNKKIAVLESRFKVKKFYDENASKGYLADTDEKRIEYLESAFLDKETDLILALRGGYGAIRIVDKINYSKIKNNNKIFLGSSDLTILLASLSKKTNAKCFHSLMVSNGFVENLDKNLKIIKEESFNINLEPIVKYKKSIKGRLWGGNLSSLVSMFSAEQYLPDDNIILFLEDLNEPMYKLDKMLYEIYRNENLRSKIKGLIFGDFYFKKDEILPLLKEYSNLFQLSSYLTFDITHKMNNVTIPYNKIIEI